MNLEEWKSNGCPINNVVNCDCLIGMKSIADNSIDLILTDPPYNQGFSGSGSLAKKYDYRREEILKISNFNPDEFLLAAQPKLKKFSAFIWTSKNLLPIYINFALKNNYNWNLLVWVKTNPIPAYNNSLLPDLEYCIYIREKGAFFNNNLRYNEYKKAMIDNVANNEYGHPTQKYLWMIEKMLRIGSNPDDLILDAYLGSGTSVIACIRQNRSYIGFETSKEYCTIAEKRIANEKKQLKIQF